MKNVALHQRGHVQQRLPVFLAPLSRPVINQAQRAQCNALLGMQGTTSIKHDMRRAGNQGIIVKPQIQPGISDNQRAGFKNGMTAE